MNEKPLFIPLKGQFFDAFKAGTKNTEYRLYGQRWNERTCRIGRRVVLSRGYGKRHRLTGKVSDFWKDGARSPGFVACYPNAGPDSFMACIQIAVDKQFDICEGR